MSALRQVGVMIVCDACVMTGCAVTSWWLKSLSDPLLGSQVYLQALPVLIVGGIIAFASFGLYPGLGRSPADELRRLSHGTTLVYLFAIATTFLTKAGDEWSRQVLVIAWVSTLIAVPLARSAVRRWCSRARWWGIPCLVLGAGATGLQVIDTLIAKPELGLKPVAIMDDDASKHGTTHRGVPIVGPIMPQVAAYAALHRVRHVILAMPGLPPQGLSRMLDELGRHIRHVHIAPAMPGSPDVIAITREFASTLILEVRQNLLRREVLLFKRVLDVLLVMIGLFCFWWVLLGIAVLVRCGSRGPVFFGHPRIGRDGRAFVAWKFRSMIPQARAALEAHLRAHPEAQAEWDRSRKLRHDPRVTWIGRVLRKTSLDELPQIWNVLRGEMSLVGPRPIVADEVTHYGYHIALYHRVLPGITGIWQISGRNDVSYDQRVGLDIYYVRNWSIWLDLWILSRTAWIAVTGKGAY